MNDVTEFGRLQSINPDCQAGKHKACRGDAWDMSADRPCPCTCHCHSETEEVAA